MKLSIIIPTYNEEKYIASIICQVQAVLLPSGIDKEIIVIDDCSTDGTYQQLAQFKGDPSVQIIRHPKNMGKTAGIVSGFKVSTGDFILIQDADLEYNPQDYPALLAPILEGKSKVVYGSRWKGSIKDMKLINRVANLISIATVNLLYGVYLTDVCGCYKIFPKEFFDKITIFSTHFGFESEVTAKALSLGYQISEVPIRYIARTRKEGKKINWRTALLMYWTLFQCRFFDNQQKKSMCTNNNFSS